MNQDNASSLTSRIKKTDAREIESYYQRSTYSHWTKASRPIEPNSAKLIKQTAGVLFEVLCAVNKTEKVEEVAPEGGPK